MGVIECEEVIDLRLYNLDVLLALCHLKDVDLDVGEDIFSDDPSIRDDKRSLDVDCILLVLFIGLTGFARLLANINTVLLLVVLELETDLESIAFAHDVQEVLQIDLEDGFITQLIVKKDELRVRDNE